MADYILGGAHNLAADRRVAGQMPAMDPGAPRTAYANRAFLLRAVEYLVGSGVRQFLDIGSGLPTVGNVHEVAQVAAPDARVLYVGIDPIAVTHSEHILAENDRAAVIDGDVRRPQQILAAPETQRLLDLEQPVAVLVVALFHLISDVDDPADIVSKLTAPLASGSYLVISHLSGDAPRDMEKYASMEAWRSNPDHVRLPRSSYRRRWRRCSGRVARDTWPTFDQKITRGGTRAARR
jgi:hypothetical protein